MQAANAASRNPQTMRHTGTSHVQLIVLGMHRSGTSMVTRLINLAGAYVGPEELLIAADKENPKGYWERSDVIAINEAILSLSGCTARIVADWKIGHPPEPPQEIADPMRSIVSSMDESRPWVMKDPRLCLTLPCWMPLLDAPLAVVICRYPLEIVRSLKTRRLEPTHSLALWEHYAVGARNASRELPRVFVRHDEIIAAPLDAMEKMVSELKTQGVSELQMPSKSKIDEFVDQKLHRANAAGLAAELALSSTQQALAAMMCGQLQQTKVLEISAASLDAMSRIRSDKKLCPCQVCS